MGHVNGSDYLVNGQSVADLANIDTQWEDSAVSYFFGDTFSSASRGRNADDSRKYFSANDAKDPLVSKDGDGTIVWGSHMAAARDAGIDSIMFGPGLANSTQGGGYRGPALDGYFWATKAQEYLKNPVLLQTPALTRSATPKLRAAASSSNRVVNGSIPSAVITVERTGDLSRPLSLPVQVVGGTADAGFDYRKTVLEKMRVSFAAGQSSALLVIPTLPTRQAQPEETLNVRIGGHTKLQPVVRSKVTLGATTKAASTSPTAIAAIGAANQIRAIETFSNPDNPGQIVAQLRAANFPDPTAANVVGETSGTNGLAAYAGDTRNTPGAYQVDLATVGFDDPNNPWLETFGEWKGVQGAAKGTSPYDTQIAWSQATLSEFFGIEVNAAGLITKIPAAAAAVFGHDDALAYASAQAWDPVANPLVGQHIDNFQTEQLSLYLAGRSPFDGSTGVQDSRTAPQSVMDLAAGIQRQVAKSLMYATYQKFQNHDAYKATFAEAQKYFGATLKITASTKAFGVSAGEEFWCRMNGSFVVAGAYVGGERLMNSLLEAFVVASKTGKGVWVIDTKNPALNVTFNRVTAAGIVGKDAVFAVDKTPLNVGPNYPSVFHYGAVVSPYDDGIDWNDKAAWGVTGRSTQGGLGYARLEAPQAVSGTTTVSEPGHHVYSGLAAGGTLTLTGAGPLVVVGTQGSGGPTVNNDGFPLGPNNNQSVTAGRTINVATFGFSTPAQILAASFYSWYGASRALQMARVDDPAVPAETPLFLYIVPAAGGSAAAALANQAAYWDSASPYYRSARVSVANVEVLGRPVSAADWATRFAVTTPAPGTGVIDASQTTGNVLIVVDDTIGTVKLGRGRTAVIGFDTNTGAKTYVLNSLPLTGSGLRPVIGIKEGDTIDASLVSGSPTWVIDNREQSTFDNKADTGTSSRRFSAFSRYFSTNGSGTIVGEFSAMFRSPTAVADPAAVVLASLRK